MTQPDNTNELTRMLLALGLHYSADHLADIVAHATKNRMGPLQLIEYVVQLEDRERTQKSLDRRHKRSKLERFKSVDKFDWAWPEKVDRDAVEAALSLEFLETQRNVVLVAPQGLGKTMLAKNIAHNAILAGHGVLFITAAEMLLDLTAQESARALERRLKYYARMAVLCLDEIGYLSYDERNADLLFRVISMRYEKKSVVMTTNLAFADWPTIFPGVACTTALVDRVIHHADVLVLEGKSYRLKEAKEEKKVMSKEKRARK